MISFVDLHKPGDGNQDLTMALRDPLHVLQELMCHPQASGHQYLGFQYYRDAMGKRVFYDTNGCLNYQQAQERAGDDACPVPVILYVDATTARKHQEYRVVYSKSPRVCSYFFVHLHTKFIFFRIFSFTKKINSFVFRIISHCSEFNEGGLLLSM